MNRWVLGLLSLVMIAGCAEPGGGEERCGELKLERPLLVLESDETAASALGRLETDGCFTEVADVVLGYDPVLASAHGAPWVCDRTGGVCFAVDGDALRLGAPVATYADADGDRASNPQDLDVDETGAIWVTRYALPTLAVIEEGGGFAAEIDLGALADSDGNPEMQGILVTGGEAFVSLEQLTEFAPTGPGKIAVIDVETREIVRSFDLVGWNPFGKLSPLAGDAGSAVVTTSGDLHSQSGVGSGVEIVNLAEGTSEQVLRGEDVGGIVFQAVIAGKNEGYAIVGTADAENATWLVRFDPEGKEATLTLADTRAPGAERGYFYTGLAVDGEVVLLADRTRTAPRVRAFRRSDGVELESVAVGLYPPVALMVL